MRARTLPNRWRMSAGTLSMIRARRFNATLLDSDGGPFAALAKRQGVSPSYFTRLVRISYLDPDITEASSTAVSRAI